jgi:hypothetical protein
MEPEHRNPVEGHDTAPTSFENFFFQPRSSAATVALKAETVLALYVSKVVFELPGLYCKIKG